MESIIADQKVARRRPIPIAGPDRSTGFPGFFRSRNQEARGGAARADFIFLEGGMGREQVRARPSGRSREIPRQGGIPRPRETPPAREASRSRGAARKFLGIPNAARIKTRQAGVGSLRLEEKPARLLRAIGGAFMRLGRSVSAATSLAVARLRGSGGTKARVFAAGIFLASAAAIWGLVALLRGPAFPLPEGSFLPEDGLAADLLLSYAVPETSSVEAEEGFSKVPPPPDILELRTYTVRSGDSIASLAKRFGLSPDSIISLNGIKNAKAVKAGATLKIPNMDGLIYRVKAGDSLGGIARAYRSDTTRLADANDLGSSVLIPGQAIFIPGAKLPASELRKIFGELVAWPVRGTISSYFGYRPNPFTGVRQFHAGLDIVERPGNPVKAAIEGRVADVGYNGIFGNYIIMNHADGLQTLYGHLSATSVAAGQRVSQGTTIGKVGSTGYSTGPHLHFGLFKGGAAVNPLKYLK